MIWDDHDYGFNNGGKNYKNKESAKTVFKAFSENENPELTNNGPGIAWSLEGKNRKFISLIIVVLEMMIKKKMECIW